VTSKMNNSYGFLPQQTSRMQDTSHILMFREFYKLQKDYCGIVSKIDNYDWFCYSSGMFAVTIRGELSNSDKVQCFITSFHSHVEKTLKKKIYFEVVDYTVIRAVRIILCANKDFNNKLKLVMSDDHGLLND
jgi:hypothetical protein